MAWQQPVRIPDLITRYYGTLPAFVLARPPEGKVRGMSSNVFDIKTEVADDYQKLQAIQEPECLDAVAKFLMNSNSLEKYRVQEVPDVKFEKWSMVPENRHGLLDTTFNGRLEDDAADFLALTYAGEVQAILGYFINYGDSGEANLQIVQLQGKPHERNKHNYLCQLAWKEALIEAAEEIARKANLFAVDVPGIKRFMERERITYPEDVLERLEQTYVGIPASLGYVYDSENDVSVKLV